MSDKDVDVETPVVEDERPTDLSSGDDEEETSEFSSDSDHDEEPAVAPDETDPEVWKASYQVCCSFCCCLHILMFLIVENRHAYSVSLYLLFLIIIEFRCLFLFVF
jgi:hypothetical protein